MSLVPKEILLSLLQRAEGAEAATLPIDFFRDLLYQAMPQQRTWVDLPLEETDAIIDMFTGDPWTAVEEIKARLKEKNT